MIKQREGAGLLRFARNDGLHHRHREAQPWRPSGLGLHKKLDCFALLATTGYTTVIARRSRGDLAALDYTQLKTLDCFAALATTETMMTASLPRLRS